MNCSPILIINSFLSIYFVPGTGLRNNPIINSHKPVRWLLRPSYPAYSSVRGRVRTEPDDGPAVPWPWLRSGEGDTWPAVPWLPLQGFLSLA